MFAACSALLQDLTNRVVGPVMADVAARVRGPCGPPWTTHGLKEGQERFLNRQLSFPVSRMSQ